jgi:hypothetical protein
MAEHLQATKIEPAATGRAVTKAQRWSATTTAWACAMTNLPDRGIHRIYLADAAKKLCAARVATVCFTALPQTKVMAEMTA